MTTTQTDPSTRATTRTIEHLESIKALATTLKDHVSNEISNVKRAGADWAAAGTAYEALRRLRHSARYLGLMTEEEIQDLEDINE